MRDPEEPQCGVTSHLAHQRALSFIFFLNKKMISSVLPGCSARKEELFLCFIICYLLSARGRARRPGKSREQTGNSGSTDDLSVHRIVFSLVVKSMFNIA